jgi:hypothetical protein
MPKWWMTLTWTTSRQHLPMTTVVALSFDSVRIATDRL